MKQGEHVFYDIFYIDEKRLNSIYSQVYWGLSSKRSESKQTQLDKETGYSRGVDKIPDIVPDVNDIPADAMSEIFEFLDSLPTEIRLRLEIENKTLGGTLNPDGLVSANEDNSFFIGNQMSLDWIVVGYCYPKEKSTNAGWSQMIEPLRQAVEMMTLENSDLRIVPLLILR